MNLIAAKSGILALLVLTLCSATDIEDVKQMISRGDPILATTRVGNGVAVYEHAPDAFENAMHHGKPLSTHREYSASARQSR